ncbi:hypothetical protein OY671_009072, partial [Metschnikowia pulcherrima]
MGGNAPRQRCLAGPAAIVVQWPASLVSAPGAPMCEIFIRASEQSYAPETRSSRSHGVATSSRSEQLFWQVSEEIAARDGMRVTQSSERSYDESVEYRGEAANFTAFSRVCCSRYQSSQAEGRIPADAAVPIRSLKPQAVSEGSPPSMYDPQPLRSKRPVA